jgi:hypothetical protein
MCVTAKKQFNSEERRLRRLQVQIGEENRLNERAIDVCDCGEEHESLREIIANLRDELSRFIRIDRTIKKYFDILCNRLSEWFELI